MPLLFNTMNAASTQMNAQIKEEKYELEHDLIDDSFLAGSNFYYHKVMP